MTKVMMSISSDYFEKIVSRKKRYEYRKRRCRQKIDGIVFYVSRPVGMILGEVAVGVPIGGDPESVWDKTKDSAGISKQELLTYCGQSRQVYAYPILDIKVYGIPYRLDDFGKKCPPQSFYYIDESDFPCSK